MPQNVIFRTISKMTLRLSQYTAAFLLPTLLMTSFAFEANMTNEGSNYNFSMDVTAHRGNSIEAPENTEASIVKAIQQGADYVEVDAQETLDGQVVLLHDDTFLRTAGINKAPCEMTIKEINALDVGSWFSPKFKGEPVPRLRDILIKYQDHVKFNIHMKNDARQKKLTKLVGEIINDTSSYANVVVTSFEYVPLKQLKTYNENIKTGLICYYNNNKLTNYVVDFYSISTEILSPTLAQNITSYGRGIHVWTVNDKQSLAKAYDLKVSNIITDNVTLARKELTARGIIIAPRIHPDWLRTSYSQ